MKQGANISTGYPLSQSKKFDPQVLIKEGTWGLKDGSAVFAFTEAQSLVLSSRGN